MKYKLHALIMVSLLWMTSGVTAQTELQFDGGFTTINDGGIAYLSNTGNLAIITQQGGGGGGPTRLDIYTPAGNFVQIVQLSTVGLQVGEDFLDNGLAGLPNGNVIALTTLGNVHEVNSATGMIVPGGYGGFNVLAALGAGAETSGFGHDPLTNNLWVINDNGNPFDTLTEFSDTGTVVSGPFFALPGNLNGDAEAVSFVPGLQTMFVAEDDTNSLIEITTTGGLVQTLSLTTLTLGSGLFVDPAGIATDFAGGRVFVSNKGDNNGNVMVFSVIGDQVLVGDINLDGVVDLNDVRPFVTLLNSGGFQAEADINQDGSVNLMDVAPFVSLLAN